MWQLVSQLFAKHGDFSCLCCSSRDDTKLKLSLFFVVVVVVLVEGSFQPPVFTGIRRNAAVQLSFWLESSSNDATTKATTAPLEELGWWVGQCLVKSDAKRNKSLDGSSTGWTAWVDETAAAQVQTCLNKIAFGVVRPRDHDVTTTTAADLLAKRDECLQWWKWLQATPEPLIVDLSIPLRGSVQRFLQDSQDAPSFSSLSEMALLQRVGCRLYVLPSGKALGRSIQLQPGSMAYGKLLYGGVRRYKLLGSGPQRQRRVAGERTEMVHPNQPGAPKSWMQYGGPERNYQALDIGPCAVLEVFLLPSGMELLSSTSSGRENEDADWVLSQGEFPWDLFHWYREEEDDDEEEESYNREKGAGKTTAEAFTDSDDIQLADLRMGMERNNMIQTTFSARLGGLQPQVESIIRRVLDGRSLGLSEGDDDAQQAAALNALGLSPVRGLLLYGPPGCGKTALAREIATLLRAQEPVVTSAPELLDRWVGGSERLVRLLFASAEAEMAAHPENPKLQVMVVDEIDAVFRKRSSGADSAQVARASAVNQLLAKLDGVLQLPNVLLIGMTNRRDLLDEALLRPGRLEVQVKIPLPDEQGRREILQIHFDALRRRGRLSQPLCRAIDGRLETTTRRWGGIGDLAAHRYTGGFSGADIAGLVRCAGSIALGRTRREETGIDSLFITWNDVQDALQEVQK